MLASVIQQALDASGAPHVQAVPPNLQPGDPAGGHAGDPCIQGGCIFLLASGNTGQ